MKSRLYASGGVVAPTRAGGTGDVYGARDARLEAAEKNTRVSTLVGVILRERMTSVRSYESAMEEYLKRKPRRLRGASRLPSRQKLHDR